MERLAVTWCANKYADRCHVDATLISTLQDAPDHLSFIVWLDAPSQARMAAFVWFLHSFIGFIHDGVPSLSSGS